MSDGLNAVKIGGCLVANFSKSNYDKWDIERYLRSELSSIESGSMVDG